MGTTIFTNGYVTLTRGDDGVDVLNVDFDDDPAATFERHEVPDGARISTTGAVSESYGRGGTVLEIVDLATLRLRFGDDVVLAEKATGACRRGTNDQGIWVCDQGSCSGSCSEKCFLGICWCSCG